MSGYAHVSRSRVFVVFRFGEHAEHNLGSTIRKEEVVKCYLNPWSRNCVNAMSDTNPGDWVVTWSWQARNKQDKHATLEPSVPLARLSGTTCEMHAIGMFAKISMEHVWPGREVSMLRHLEQVDSRKRLFVDFKSRHWAVTVTKSNAQRRWKCLKYYFRWFMTIRYFYGWFV